MKTSLHHLPQHKQHEIQQIADIIREVAHPEKIILYGSYATGGWVEDQYFEEGTRYSYISDYDFLVVTKDSSEKEYLLNDKIVNRAKAITAIPVNCIIHDISYINEGLSFGQYFFADIIKEGVLLYESGKVDFVEPKELTPAEQKQVAKNYFDIWFERGSEFLQASGDCLHRKQLKIGVFLLHQTTECFYNTVLLVFTGYKPKTHSLEKLRQYVKPCSRELLDIFPEKPEDENEYRLFDLLKRGYIDARYKQGYSITDEELTELIRRVKMMQEVVEKICSKKIRSFE